MIQVRTEELRDPAASGWNAGPTIGFSAPPEDSTGIAPPPAAFTMPSPSAATGTFSQHPHDPYGSAFAHPEVQSLSSVERSTFIWLAVLAGFFGAHNLYANRTTAGIIQLCTSLLSCLLLSPVVWIWALVEAATVDQDGDGLPWR
jgi:TM2 domain-containing membrane protein YozV